MIEQALTSVTKTNSIGVGKLNHAALAFGEPAGAGWRAFTGHGQSGSSAHAMPRASSSARVAFRR